MGKGRAKEGEGGGTHVGFDEGWGDDAGWDGEEGCHVGAGTGIVVKGKG